MLLFLIPRLSLLLLPMLSLMLLLLLQLSPLLLGQLSALTSLNAAKEQTNVVPVALQVRCESPHESRLLARLLLVHVYWHHCLLLATADTSMPQPKEVAMMATHVGACCKIVCAYEAQLAATTAPLHNRPLHVLPRTYHVVIAFHMKLPARCRTLVTVMMGSQSHCLHLGPLWTPSPQHLSSTQPEAVVELSRNIFQRVTPAVRLSAPRAQQLVRQQAHVSAQRLLHTSDADAMAAAHLFQAIPVLAVAKMLCAPHRGRRRSCALQAPQAQLQDPQLPGTLW